MTRESGSLNSKQLVWRLSLHQFLEDVPLLRHHQTLASPLASPRHRPVPTFASAVKAFRQEVKRVLAIWEYPVSLHLS